MDITVKKFCCSCVIGGGSNDPTPKCDFGQQVKNVWETLT